MRLEAWVLATTFTLAALAGTARSQRSERPTPSRAPAAAQPARKGQLDKNQQEALRKTQDMLRSPAARGDAVRADPKARAANQRVESLGRSPKNTQRMYEISADVLGEVTARGGGDPARMNQVVEQAQRDPAAFLQSLPPEQQAAIKQLAEELAREHPELASPQPPR